MTHSMVVALLAGPSIVAVAVLFGAWRKTSVPWNMSASFIFCMGWLFVGPDVVSAFGNGRILTYDSEQSPIVVLEPWVMRLQTFSHYLLFIVPVLFIVYRLSRNLSSPNPLPIMAIVIVLFSGIASFAAGHSLITNGSVTLGVALVAASVLPSGTGSITGAAWFGSTFAAAGGILSLFNFDTVAVSCAGHYKCGPLGVLVLGALESENAFGLILAASIPFVWFSFTYRTKSYLLTYILYMVVVSSSRTSTYGALATLGALILLWLKLSRPATKKLSQFLAAAFVVATFAFGCILPFLISDQHSFTDRGLVWLIARRHLSQHYLIGLGAPAWSSLTRTGELPLSAVYSTHNQWLDILWTSGLIGAIVLGTILFALIRINWRVALSLMLPVVFLGASERIWGLSAYDAWSYSYLAILMALSPVAGQSLGWQSTHLSAHGMTSADDPTLEANAEKTVLRLGDSTRAPG